jgi:hypothetical protein
MTHKTIHLLVQRKGVHYDIRRCVKLGDPHEVLKGLRLIRLDRPAYGTLMFRFRHPAADSRALNHDAQSSESSTRLRYNLVKSFGPRRPRVLETTM